MNDMEADVEAYESHEAWLDRQAEFLKSVGWRVDELTGRRDFWTGRRTDRQLGTVRVDRYWSRWLLTMAEAFGRWLARTGERFLRDVGEGLKRGLSHPAVVIAVVFVVAVVFMFVLGRGGL